MRRSASAAALLLAACGAGETPRDMTREEVTAEVSDVRVSPGEWEHTTQVLGVEAPDLPYDLATRLRQRRNAFRYCITPEQAAQPARVSETVARPNAGCTMQNFTMRGSRMEGRMICHAGTPRQTATAMSGTYSPDAFDYRSQVEMPAPLARGTMRLDVRTTGRRLGPCPETGEVKQ